MAMQAWISRLSVVAIVAASVTVLSSTGCKSSGSWARVPGVSWLSRNREKAPPTMLADNDPTGHLPPPSAVADPYSPSGSTPTRGSSVASYDRRPAANGYPATDYSRENLAQKDSRSYQTGPYNTGPVTSGPVSPSQDRYLGQPAPDPYGSRDLPSSGSSGLPADRWSQQTANGNDRETRAPETGDLPTQRDISGSSTYGAGQSERYAASDRSYAERYDRAPAESIDRGSSYPGAMDSAPSGYYSQPPTRNGELDRSVAAARQPEPYSRDLTADPYDDASGVRMADHRANALYESPQSAPEHGVSARPPERSVEPWRPGSTGDYRGNDSSSVESGRYQSASPDRETGAPAGYPADYGTYTR